ncbi:MAG: InlB B-repeat-containing protein [Treponema sp.]|jgi:hypothetical protein|nr:InlB B-repeat-containing protein [Treponema sp.]
MKRKQLLSGILGVMLVFGLVLTGCDNILGNNDDDNNGGTIYTVTYNTGEGGGTASAAQSVASGTRITLPDKGSMTASGKTFAGWKVGTQTYAAGASYTVTADVTFTAQWVSSTGTTYTVTYAAGEGSGAVPATQSDVVSGVSIALPGQGSMTAPSGKIFGGWSAGTETFAAGASYTVTADVTFTAQWRVSGGTTYTVMYNGNGNTGGTAPVDSSSPYASGITVTVLGNTGSLVKTGSTFAGWNTAAGGSGTSYAAGARFTINSNTVLYAQWTTSGGNGSDTVTGAGLSTLTLSGQQVYTDTSDVDDDYPTYTVYNGSITGITGRAYDYDANEHVAIGGTGSITNGKLSFTIGTPTPVPATLDHVMAGTLEIFSEVTCSTPISSVQAALLRLEPPNNSGYYYLDNNTVTEYEAVAVGYFYVDRDITITGTGRTVTQTREGITSTAIVPNVTMTLKTGWNVLSIKEAITKTSSTSRTFTYSFSAGDAGGKWVLD